MPSALSTRHAWVPGIVELAALPDHDRPGPDDQHRLQVAATRHHVLPFGWTRSPRVVRMWAAFSANIAENAARIGGRPAGRTGAEAGITGALHGRAELLEQADRVVRAGGGLGVVLDAEDGAVQHPQALDHAVVEVDVADLRGTVGGVERLRGPRPGCAPTRSRRSRRQGQGTGGPTGWRGHRSGRAGGLEGPGEPEGRLDRESAGPGAGLRRPGSQAARRRSRGCGWSPARGRWPGPSPAGSRRGGRSAACRCPGPSARPRIWLPRQIPNTGTPASSTPRIASTA